MRKIVAALAPALNQSAFTRHKPWTLTRYGIYEVHLPRNLCEAGTARERERENIP